MIAGTGDCDSSGDGGPAVDATFATPAGLAVTASGLLVVFDYNNEATATGNVRLILTNRTITLPPSGQHRRLRRGGRLAVRRIVAALLHHRPARRRPRASVGRDSSSSPHAHSQVQTSLLQGGRRIRTLTRQGSAGLNVVKLPGVSHGSYTMEIKSTGTVDNNNADAGGTLTLSKRDKEPLTVRR